MKSKKKTSEIINRMSLIIINNFKLIPFYFLDFKTINAFLICLDNGKHY